MFWLRPVSLGGAWFWHSAVLEAYVYFGPIYVSVLFRDTLPLSLEETRLAVALCNSWHVCQDNSCVLSLLKLLVTSIGKTLPTLCVALLCIVLRTNTSKLTPLDQY